MVAVWAALSLCAGFSALADQNDPKLPDYYDQLQAAESSSEAVEIESRIWQSWLAAPDDESDRLLREVVSALEQRDLREALIISSILVENYPDYSEGWNKRATIYYLMGDFDSSVADIGETLRLEPRHFGAISGLGLIFRANGDLEASLDAFEQVLRISPQSSNAQRSVADLKNLLGSEI
ncbi:MAG: tetratricopeptide repeat protein [Granulosicoccus sp.]|nr:tetratricopeptide repeat protein [Granulosicoccus sp.]